MITPQDIRDYLVGYGIDAATLPDSFIQSRIDSTIAKIELECGKSFFEIKEVEEYTTAYGSYTLQLLHFPITEIVEIEIVGDYYDLPPDLNTTEKKLGSGDYIANLKQGQITFKSNMAWFPEDENSVKATYKHGYASPPADAVEGLINMIAGACLQNVSSRKGDEKSKSIEGWSVTYSGKSPFGSVVNDFKIMGSEYLSNYYEAIG